jgi:hypothetical protein
MDNRELLERYAAAPAALEERLRGLSSEQLDFRPFPEAWTVREQAVHLADAELHAAVRLRKILAQSGEAVDVYDEEKWQAGLDYGAQDPLRAAGLFRLLREAAAALLARARPQQWADNWVLHPERGRLSLRGWLELYVEHSDTHLGYIERNLGLWRERGGPRRPGPTAG